MKEGPPVDPLSKGNKSGGEDPKRVWKEKSISNYM